MEPNFYEILEIAPEAPTQQIERAYRIARATYQPASTATYSVFSDEQNAEILRRIEEAYEVLSDTRLRREYDARLRREGSPPAGVRPARSAPAPPPLQRQLGAPEPDPPARKLEISFDVPDDPDDGVFDGPALRRARINRGVEIEDIAAITKINQAYLQFIEANRYQDLPPRVYLRGFLREVAKCLKLDPTAVVETYMARYDSAGGELA